MLLRCFQVVIGRLSEYCASPVIKVNCGAIPETLIDSELLDHEKGAFTLGAARKPGHFERAHTLTIFLDEMGELPLGAQLLGVHPSALRAQMRKLGVPFGRKSD